VHYSWVKRGEGFAQLLNFSNFLGNPPLSMSTQFGLTCLKTSNAKNRENIPGSDRDPSRVCYICKKLLHSIFQYKIRSKDRQLNRTWSQPVPGRVDQGRRGDKYCLICYTHTRSMSWPVQKYFWNIKFEWLKTVAFGLLFFCNKHICTIEHTY